MGILILILFLFLLTAIIFVSFSNPTPHLIQAANEEDFEVNNSVMICCTWGEKLSDGKLTYNIEGEVSVEKKEAVRNAIRDWDGMLNFVEFIEIPEKDEAQQKENQIFK